MENFYLEEYQLIGNNIKKIRQNLKLTQAQLASKCEGKIDHAKISDIERAKEDFHMSTLLKICKGLNITLKELITFKAD